MTLRTFSNGGGVQSTAALILSARGEIDFPIHLFCNVGDDSEHPDTLIHVREVLMPYAEKHGIAFHEIQKTMRDGTPETLMGRLTKEGSRSLPIPIRMSNGAPGQRSCTANFKIQVIGKWQKAHGASAETPAVTGIGISTDEIQRAGRGRDDPHQTREYPLIDLGLRRSDCEQIIASEGIGPVPRSACFFCPFHRPQTWAEMRRDRPDLFEKSAELEDLLNARRDQLGKDHVWMTRFNKPLRDAIGAAGDEFDFGTPAGTEMDEGECDEGVCFV